jgi:hypothetical protein
MEEEGSMSEQAETDDSTSLEEVFNSREFGRVAGVEEVVVTKEFGVATRFAAPVLRNAVVGLSDPPFEDVLHSARAGRSLTLVAPLPSGALVGIAMPAEDAAVTPLDTRRPERNRYRAVAAVSGIAAAALVVAGITSGTVQQRPSEVSAQGARLSGAGSAVPGGPTPTATLSAAAGDGAGSSVLGSDSPLTAGNASGGHVTLSGPATTSGTAVPSPTVASGGVPTGGGGAPGSPPPPPASGGPVTPVTTSVGAAGTLVTAVADQLGSSVPSTAPTASGAATVMGGIDQTVASTMG